MKQIPFAKSYTVDTNGDIFSNHINRLLTPTIMACGYMRVKLVCDDGKQRAFLVHRVVAITYLQNPLDKKEVNHINGVKSDNNLHNLEWVTRE